MVCVFFLSGGVCPVGRFVFVLSLPRSASAWPSLLRGLKEHLGSEETEVLKQQYILVSPKFSYGAEILLHTDILEGMAEMLQADLYIVPLAVDAVEMVPVGNGISLEEIYEEMRTVESMKMENADFLSNYLYIYRTDTREIEQMSIEKMKPFYQ